MKRIRILSLAFVVITLLSLVAVNNFAHAQPTAIFHGVKNESPYTTSNWNIPETQIGQTVTIAVYITDVTPIWGWAIEEVTWNPAVLQFDRLNEGDFLRGGPADEPLYETFTVKGTANQQYGVLNGGTAASLLGDVQQTDSNGVLCTIRFIIVGTGDANIHIDTPVLVEDYRSQPVQLPDAVVDPVVTVGDTSGKHTLAVSSVDVEGNFQQYGVPSPLGVTSWTPGSEVTATITSPHIIGVLTYDCVGWVGTGDVPASGTGTSVSFTITQDSTITWQWVLHDDSNPEPDPTPDHPVTLTVTSEYGSPVPTGIQTRESGSQIICTIPTTPLTVNGVTYNTVTDSGVTYVCVGWVGTGDVPASGTGTSVSFTITQDSTITWQWALLPASIDISTNKGGTGWNVSANAFGPEEQVTVIAKVNSAGGVPRAGQQVVLTLTYANGNSYSIPAASTNTNGLITTSFRLEWANPDPAVNFGVAKISATAVMAETTLNDTLNFQYNYILRVTDVEITNSNGHSSPTNGPYFSRYDGPAVQVKVTVKNYHWSLSSSDVTNFYLSGTIYDNNNVPVAYQLLPEAINPVVSESLNPDGSYSTIFTLTLNIPSYAFVGQANLYVNIFTDNPTNLGAPFCPETSAKLMIDAS
jgi:hypothetical protein